MFFQVLLLIRYLEMTQKKISTFVPCSPSGTFAGMVSWWRPSVPATPTGGMQSGSKGSKMTRSGGAGAMLSSSGS